MIWRGKRTKGARWLAAWAAAYALVFQVVFTSAAVAALPRDAASTILCLNSASAADPVQSDGRTIPPGVHCPACLARIDLAFLPTPAPTPFVVRTVVVVPFRPVALRSVVTAALRLPLQPRAPPGHGLI